MDANAAHNPLAHLFAVSENTEPARPPTEAELDRFASLMADLFEDRWKRRNVREIEGRGAPIVA